MVLTHIPALLRALPVSLFLSQFIISDTQAVIVKAPKPLISRAPHRNGAWRARLFLGLTRFLVAQWIQYT